MGIVCNLQYYLQSGLITVDVFNNQSDVTIGLASAYTFSKRAYKTLH